MKRKSRRLLLVISLSIGLTLAIVSVAVATIITVDGDPTDWPGNGGCTIGEVGCALVTTDTVESGIPITQNLTSFWATNSVNSAFFRYDTDGDTSYPNGGELVRICMNTPPLTDTLGQTDVGGCEGLMTNRMVLIRDFGSGLGGRVYNCNAVNCNSPFAAFVDTATFSNTGTTNEVGAALADLDLTDSDGLTVTMVVYFDNNSDPDDDRVPGVGSFTWPVGTGSPTAITLTKLTARSAPTSWVPLVGISALVLGVVSFLVLYWRRRKQPA